MDFELDHLFVFSDIGAPEAGLLLENGFTEGTANIHPGQGTSNRRFFFKNAMLEFLWVHDGDEAQSERTIPTFLYQRWLQRSNGSCPLGICLRPIYKHIEIPFAGWPYKPVYLPENLAIHVANNVSNLTHPFLFYLPFTSRSNYQQLDQPKDHGPSVERITRLILTTPLANDLRDETNALVDFDILEIKRGKDYLLEVYLDHGKQNLEIDFRNRLPLILRY